MPTDIKYYQEFGGEKIIFEKEEVSEMKKFAEPGDSDSEIVAHAFNICIHSFCMALHIEVSWLFSGQSGLPSGVFGYRGPNNRNGNCGS